MSEELKTKRRYKKGAFTRLANALSRAAVDNDLDELSELKVKAKVAFREFANCHDEYQETLENDRDKLESEDYYQEVDTTYLNVLREV